MTEPVTPADETAPAAPDASPALDPERYDELEEAMRDVVDPDSEDDDAVTIDMTLTSAACPLTDVIEDQSRNALVRSGLCDELRINWVWMPPWGPDKITDDGREQLRALGFTV
ncbi:MAG: metal-sulfur cluster biosynthetic enzyme [Acidobacteria bacterium]|nr:MAG: metal-sulfur cluster biosynthetic enzyme [Acidobacteriota bacterium]